MATRRIPWLNKMNNEGKEVVPGATTPPGAVPAPVVPKAPQTTMSKPGPVSPAPSLGPSPAAPDKTYTTMGDAEKAQLAEAKLKQQRTQGLADTLAQQQGKQHLLERKGPVQSPVTSRGTQAPPATTGTVQDATLAALQELLGTGVRDTTAEQAQAAAVSEAAIGKALADQRARQGFAGFGLSGASAAQDADVRRVGARELTGTQQAIDAQARNEYLQRVQLAAGAASQFQGNEIERQAWNVAMQQLENELGIDLNNDGIKGNGTQERDKAKADEATARAAASALAQGRPKLSAAQRADMGKQGIDVKPVKRGNPPFDYYEWEDQFGNVYEMSDDEQKKYLYNQ